MTAPLWKWDWDYLWHFLGGGVIEAVTIFGLLHSGFDWWLSLMLAVAMIVILTAGGLLREKIQHDWRTLTPHQLLEGWLWGIGGAMAFLIAPYVL